MTLGVNVILQGLIVIYTGGLPTPPAPDAIRFLAVGRIGPIPVIGILWAVLAVLASLADVEDRVRSLSSTPSAATRRWPSSRACRPRERPSGPMCCPSMTAALAGMLLTGYSGQAYLGMGDPYLFTSIAAVAIGGASILGADRPLHSARWPGRSC
jgi:ribose transport system permease protein